jgi:hypothetical protein
MTKETEPISIWFFIGVLLAFYGAIILAYGLYAFNDPPSADRVLSELHADVWWGALMLVIGLVYSLKFAPRRGH